MFAVDLTGKSALVFGVANHRSIAWSIAQVLHQAGARLALAYQNERLREPVAKLAASVGDAMLVQCDVTEDEQVSRAFEEVGERFGELEAVVHSIAYANRDDLGGDFSKTGREGFRTALEISAYSLVPIVREAAALMPQGGSVVTMTFLAAERVFPGYNVMGVAKAALENEVRQLAAEYGPRNIRVNAISAGATGYPVVAGHRQLPGHEAGAPGAGAAEAQRDPRGRGRHGPLPVQRPLERGDGGGDPRGRGVRDHGGVGV